MTAKGDEDRFPHTLDSTDESKAGEFADRLVFWINDNLPSWGDNDPYYALRAKAKELFEDALSGSA